MAEMTLTLPPEHPLLRGQLYDPTTSFNDLATHKINGAERRWTGQARRLKVSICTLTITEFSGGGPERCHSQLYRRQWSSLGQLPRHAVC